MALTIKEFQSKAEQVDIHPERTDQPWTFVLTSLASETGKFSKTVELGLRKGSLTNEEKEKAIDNAWKSLWCLAAACRFAGISLEEVAERGMTGLDQIGDDVLPQ